MKILVLDMLYPRGHKSLSKALIRLLSRFSDVFVVDYKNYYEGLTENDKIQKINIDSQLFFSKGAPLIHMASFYNLLLTKIKLQNINYDAIIFFSISNTSYYYARKIFKDTPVFVFHHNNIDKLTKKKEFRLFQKYMNTINHIVFADFIKDGFESLTGINSNLVHVLNHPMDADIPNDLNNQIEPEKKCIKTFVGLGLSNDEELIDQLILLDKKIDEEVDAKIILRSKEKKYSGKIVDIISGYLENDEYNRLYKNSEGCLVCYPRTFNLRYSGTFMNAMINKKVIISTDISLARHFNYQYPNNCIVAKNAEHIIEIVKGFNRKFDMSEYAKFMNAHGDNKISEDLYNLLKKKV